MEKIARSPKQLGAIIRSARRAQKKTQTQLGEQTSLRQATISSIENGEDAAKFNTLSNVLAALGLEIIVRERNETKPQDIEDIF